MAALLAVDPHTRDLAAHVYRAELFGREGFTVWNGNWYGGHHTPAYSVLFPPIASVLGPSLAGALSAVAAAALFEPLARRHFGERAFWGTVWFAVGCATLAFNGRMTFAAGVALGLGALLALQRGRRALALVLAVLCSLASPVSGLFLGVAAGAVFLAGRRGDGLALGMAAMLPIAVLVFAFPEGGTEPFVPSAFWPLAAFCALAALLLPREERALRAGALLFLLLATALFLVDTPVGGNVARLSAFGGPIVACALAGRGHPRALIVPAVAALAFWQLWPAYRDIRDALGDPASKASFYEPLDDFLAANAGPGERVEVVFTQSHWEAAEVADRFPLARGWERQMDTKVNALFYDGRLTDERYAAWLAERAVRWVALAGAELDYSGRQEAAFVRRGPPYLRDRGSRGRWRIYEVADPRPLAEGARVAGTGPEEVVLDFARPGDALVRVNWSPYWLAEGACVEERNGLTSVTARRAGRIRLVMRFSPERVLSRGRRCG